MRSDRLSFTARGEGEGGARRRTSSVLTAVALASVLALTATACDSEGADADARASASAASASSGEGDGKITIPDDIKDRLKEHGIDVDQWKNGAWKDWDRDDWLREAQDYINPIIEGLWDPDRMRRAEDPDRGIRESDLSGDQGVTDPEPAPVDAKAVSPTYHNNVPEAGKVFFDSPEGTMVCSATVVEDPAAPGRSNLVWTAGHCVHAGRNGGWYRNIAFVPSYNDQALSGEELTSASEDELAPYGVWWADWAGTSEQWIAQGGPTGGAGAPYDFAVIHVTPEGGGNGKSLEETVGSALPVDFAAPAVPRVRTITASGYPAAAPFDGESLYQCQDRPGRLSLNAADPTMYRIGCTMTGGSSGGGWVAAGADGRPALVSNTSIGPVNAGWLAGPRLGRVAEGVYDSVSRKRSGQ
ncbi:trypsin-like serine peptidase [Streptomyces griseorubiginosus]|uniref:trypsin-like serine peptidase n=1 Tax=Streptomyces griseorubiginosus TaxID=67304 RepID=UPI003639A924